MAIVGLYCKRGYRTVDECLVCHQRCIIMAPILELKDKMEHGYYASRSREYHVTSLLGCPRRVILGRECDEFAPTKNIWRMQLGTLGHELMEKYPVGVGESEKLLTHQFDVMVNGKVERCKIVGKFDWFGHDDHLLHDYKFVGTTDYIPNDKHYQQMAVYYIIGTMSKELKEEDIIGAQIDYVHVLSGAFYPHRETGESFYKHIEMMRTRILDMMRYYIKAEVNGLVPIGDPEQKECAYCSPEFKAHCKEGGYLRMGNNELRSLKISINTFRRENTPSDDED